MAQAIDQLTSMLTDDGSCASAATGNPRRIHSNREVSDESSRYLSPEKQDAYEAVAHAADT
jgi:hypothetical protein